VAFVGGGVSDRHLAPRQRIEYVEQGLPVLLDREHELAAMVMDMVRGGRHCMQRIGGHDLVVQAGLAGHHRGHRHLIGFHADLCLRGDHRGSGVRAGHDRRRGQRQDGRNRMIPALAHPAIRHPANSSSRSRHASDTGTDTIGPAGADAAAQMTD
jgi:hypothetical protein